MKVHQKIFIGIAVGTVFGLLLGPQSLVLEKDTLHLLDPSRVELREDIANAKSRLSLPKNITTDFRIERELTQGAVRWIQLSWTPTARHLAAASGETVSGQSLKVGEPRRVFLRASDAPPPSSGLGHRILGWVSPFGEIFLRLILMLVVPLVFTTLTVGTASLGSVRSLERYGLMTLVYFVITSSIAIALGMGLAMAIAPGRGIAPNDALLLAEQFKFLVSGAVEQVQRTPDFMTFIVQIVPDNPIHSMASPHPNILQVMFFSIMFGVALTLIPESRSRQVLKLLDKTSKVLLMVMHMVMAIAPFGVACLIAQTVGITGYQVFGALGSYIAVVVVGLLLHVGITTAVARYCGVSVGAFWRAVRPAALIALGTASSTATLPVSLTVAEDSLGVSRKVSSFTLSLGSTMNMPGTALFQGAALIFIGQAFGVEIPASALLTSFFTILFMAIGTAAVPSAGIVTLALALSSVGLPPVGIGLVVGFDRLLDMLRTPVNVLSDLSAAVFLARKTGESPNPLTSEEDVNSAELGFESRLKVDQVAYGQKEKRR